MLNRLLIVLALAAVPAAGAAQHAPPGLAAPVREPGVTLTLAAYLVPSASGQLAVPLPLLERLAAEDALLALDTAPAEGRVVVQVRFGFPDMAAFQRWYTDERTVRLLRDVRSVVIGGSLETFISYRPGMVP
jgi:hypothetical protein